MTLPDNRGASFRAVRRASLFACGLVLCATAVASMTVVTLAELINESEVIVYGYVAESPAGALDKTSSAVTFQVLTVLKGKAAVKQDLIVICNPHDNSEWPDLSKMKGRKVMFVSKKGDCFDLSHGYKSIVGTQGNRAETVAIRGQPHDQPLNQFLEKLRTLISERR